MGKKERLTPVAHLAYMTPFHSPSMEQKDFLSLGELKEKYKFILVGLHIKTFRNVISSSAMFLLLNLSSDSVLLPSVEGFGVKNNVGAVAWLGAGDAALPAQLHPRHSQNGPGRAGSRLVKHVLIKREMSDRCGNTGTPTCHIH